jgi:hypothetical protein
MLFDYDGDEPGGQILSWFKKQLKAIGTLWDEELPLALLTTVYSGIDAFGLQTELHSILKRQMKCGQNDQLFQTERGCKH